MKTIISPIKSFRILVLTVGALWLTACRPNAGDERPSVRARNSLMSVEQRVAAHEIASADTLLIDEIEFFDQHEMYDELQRAWLLRADLLFDDDRPAEATPYLLRGLALATGLGDTIMRAQILHRLRDEVDTTLNVSLACQLLDTQLDVQHRHSFDTSPVSFSSLSLTWTILLSVMLVGCLAYYKIKVDHQLQIEKVKWLREQIAHRDAHQLQAFNQLREDAVVRRFRQSFTHSVTITADDWSALRQRFTELCPNFENQLRQIHSLSDVEWQVCMLLKLEFTPSDISVLTARSQATISTIRSRLYSKFFLQKGSAADWDRFIASL